MKEEKDVELVKFFAKLMVRVFVKSFFKKTARKLVRLLDHCVKDPFRDEEVGEFSLLFFPLSKQFKASGQMMISLTLKNKKLGLSYPYLLF